MGVGGEDLCKGVSHLDLSVESNFLGDSSIESHQKARVVIVMLGHRGIVIVLEA
jgi:hypothetical protein